ncbi:protein IMPAIRED IN BABA-INDUCED STERILITY 1-like [Impatiens glandulifera]|uniref:protein IMPAIRED IN BABA-INDUCED STERILITY 1-like n=1 Tax=Impatiens glandulifera TaxID=253017 RepID=UPI001FB10458|nr:protein IMPAIRED IN BABA-INDUCED STERILITY 1-like [Impatiens glandulifera]
MGCVTSKQTVSVTPAIDYSGAIRDNGELGQSGRKSENGKKKKKRTDSGVSDCDLSELGKSNSINEFVSFRMGNVRRNVAEEQLAAGWPTWLTAVAGEAIQGWVPLNADSFEKMEKVGQGTYSSVFKARQTETGKIFALKKVRFENFEPESVRFMAREINILRKLHDHPNIIKLEGLIASKLSCSLYLVFEYMEHDVAGLVSNPDLKFSESQVKCYMKQLLLGIEHCHSKGIMHRDIKGANLLVNDNGTLKVADFGLANSFGQKQPLTSRVVTLWYRPPELLLGSTNYGASVDLWSIGCVFAELLLGKPILQGRTEVEQLHKIFKLCGSPPEDYWKKSKLPHATLFKSQNPYESSLWETCKDLPKTAVELIETLLSVEPHKRGTATSALASEYFSTKPYACEPSSFPKYPPSKEIDAKYREERAEKKPIERARVSDTTRKLTRRRPNVINKLAPAEALNSTRKINDLKEIEVSSQRREAPKTSSSSIDATKEEGSSHTKNASSQGDVPFSGPLQISGSSGFAWAKRRLDESSVKSHSRSSSRSLFEPIRGEDEDERIRQAMLKQWSQFDQPDSFDASDEYHSQELSMTLYNRNRNNVGYQDRRQGDEKVEFSGPLLSQSHKVDELLAKHDRQIRQAIRKSWFHRGKKR